jgi:hypothetical protein
MVKVQLLGNRSNASGLGCKVEIETGGLRLLRSVQRLPIEIGVGRYERLDAFLVHWLNWPQGSTETPVRCDEPILAVEAIIQEGSCPYLYAWDGQRFRFITDILGAAPLGLPVAEGRYIEPDAEELVRVGDETTFPPKDGHRVVSITEELREVLYLDEAKLVVVDHEPGGGGSLHRQAAARRPISSRNLVDAPSRATVATCRDPGGPRGNRGPAFDRCTTRLPASTADPAASRLGGAPRLRVGFRTSGHRSPAGAGHEWLAPIRRRNGQYRGLPGPRTALSFSSARGGVRRGSMAEIGRGRGARPRGRPRRFSSISTANCRPAHTDSVSARRMKSTGTASRSSKRRRNPRRGFPG